MAQRKVASVRYNGLYEVIFDSEKDIPYAIRYTDFVYKNGTWKKTRKTIQKYKDFSSCLFYLYDKVDEGFIHGRVIR